MKPTSSMYSWPSKLDVPKATVVFLLSRNKPEMQPKHCHDTVLRVHVEYNNKHFGPLNFIIVLLIAGTILKYNRRLQLYKQSFRLQ